MAEKFTTEERFVETVGSDNNSNNTDSVPDWVTNADPKWIDSITKKMDLRILPVMSLLYLMSFLDRTNIGNARIDGLATDLKLTNETYNLCLTVFFFTYCAFEVPSNLALKKFGAKLWIPIIMAAWGLVMTFMGLVNSYHGLLISRIFLGAAEAGLFPGVTYYLTTWYPRKQIAFRVAVFFSAATIAGGFGGLLAFALAKLRGKGDLKGWQWIFLLEGVLTVVVAAFAYFLIVDNPQTCKFLTPEEKIIVGYRISHDGTDTPMDDSFHMKYVIAGAMDWKLWVNIVIYWGSLIPLYCTAYFLPSIVRGMGYTAAKSQLLTVPVYTIACLFVVAAAWGADRIGKRSPVIILFLAIAMCGWGGAFAASNPQIRYGMMFIAAIGSYSSFPPVVALLTSNVGGKTKRATAIALQVGIGGMAGAVSANIFRVVDAPRYLLGLALCLGFCALGIVAVLVNWALLIQANRNKQKKIDSGEAARFTKQELSEMGDASPFYKYHY